MRTADRSRSATTITRDPPGSAAIPFLLADSPFWGAGYEAFVRDLVSDLEYVTFEGVSHFLMLDRPQEFNSLVKGWSARHLTP